MSAIQLDPRMMLFVNNAWEDITRKVRVENGIEWFDGKQDESSEPDPGWCKFVLHNLNGEFTPRNPMSPYAGFLNVNTPMCLLLDEVTDTFTRTASNSWGSTDTGETYLSTGAGGVVSATDFSTNGSHGIHSVPAASAYRYSVLDVSLNARSAHNTIQKIKYFPQFSDVTGGAIEPANLFCRWANSSNFYHARVVVNTDETVTVAIHEGQSSVLAGPVVVPGLTHVINQPFWIKLGAIDEQIMATVWQGDDPEDEPTDWLVMAEDTTLSGGFYGVRTGVAAGNSNAKPILAHYDNYSVWIGQFSGEIPEFPQAFSDDNVDQVIEVEAAGLLRRYIEGKGVDFRSSARRWYESVVDETPTWYWPLDDGELANFGRATIVPSGQSGNEVTFQFDYDTAISPDSANEKHFSQAKIAPWLPNGVTLTPDSAAIVVALPDGVNNVVGEKFTFDWTWVGGGAAQSSLNMIGNFAAGVLHVGLDTDSHAVFIDAATNTLTVFPGFNETQQDFLISSLPVNILDGKFHAFRYRANVTLSTDIFWQLWIDGVLVADDTTPTHPMIATVTGCFIANTNFDTGDDIGFGHVAIWHAGVDPSGNQVPTFDAINGKQSETARARAIRLMDEESVPNFMSGTGGAEMGPQYADNLMDQLFEIMRTDGGTIRELNTARGLVYYSLSELRATEEVLVIDVSNKELGPGFAPVDGTQNLRNRVRAIKRDGGDFTHEKTDGRLGTADPKLGGAGVYAGGDVKANPYLPGDLVDIAQLAVAQGTIDKARYPELSVNMRAQAILSNLDLRRNCLDTLVAHRIRLTNMQASHIYEDASLFVVGVTRYVTNHEHIITWNTIPFDSFDVFRVETPLSILGTSTTSICDDIDDNDTIARIVTEGQALWTTEAGSFPILGRLGIRPSGEDVSISDCDTVAPAFRSVGTASHGDNVTTTPGLPSGHTAGDTLLLITAIRNTAATADTPTGYEVISSSGHYKICAKIDNGAESVPNCTYSGGAAGDSTSSFIMAFQNMPFDYANATIVSTSVNGSAQNIAIPTQDIPRCNGIQLLLAWKQAGWTNVTAPGEFIEISEYFTTLGNDQGLYASYRLVPYIDESPSGSLVVNGGLSAVSKGILAHFANSQTITFSRSENGVVKSWPAGTDLRIAYPKLLG